MSDWISFLCVNEVREQKRIADKENLQNQIEFNSKMEYSFTGVLLPTKSQLPSSV